MKNNKTVNKVIDSYHESKFDPNGSYTGIDQKNPNQTPTQDADDL